MQQTYPRGWGFRLCGYARRGFLATTRLRLKAITAKLAYLLADDLPYLLHKPSPVCRLIALLLYSTHAVAMRCASLRLIENLQLFRFSLHPPV
jgi:hypothetical protein